MNDPAATPTPAGNAWSHAIGADGSFQRASAGFRAAVEDRPDALHPAAPGRYRLYVSLACPWAHRTLIVRALKGLEDAIAVDVVHPHLGPEGWRFDTGFPATTGDRSAAPAQGRHLLREVYAESEPGYRGVVTVPVLWDGLRRRIVNNESSEIIRMLGAAFDRWASRPELDLYPAALRAEIDAVNAWVYPAINNGVYRCGFARSQGAYDAALEELFDGLDRAEALLQRQDWLVGGRLTEADVRLFTTLIRFDAVYHTHFKCNRRLLAQYPALHRHTARVFHLPGVAATVDLLHIRQHYYHSHRHLNPSGIVPPGPDVLGALAAHAPGG